jgi:hypothetical protein
MRQIHDIEFAPNLDIIVEQTLPALDALRALNKVRLPPSSFRFSFIIYSRHFPTRI